MKYEAIVYFAGPKTIWSGKVAEEEILIRRESRYLWLARSLAQSAYQLLDPTRVGYVVMKDGREVEHVEPQLKQPLRKGRTASHLTG